MKFISYLTIFLCFSCAHKEAHRNPAQKGKMTCMEAVRSILKERKVKEQTQLIFEAKQKVKDWEELDGNSEVIEIIGEDLEGSRKEMALLSMAILRRDYPNESIPQLGLRFKNLKKLCTGP